MAVVLQFEAAIWKVLDKYKFPEQIPMHCPNFLILFMVKASRLLISSLVKVAIAEET